MSSSDSIIKQFQEETFKLFRNGNSTVKELQKLLNFCPTLFEQKLIFCEPGTAYKNFTSFTHIAVWYSPRNKPEVLQFVLDHGGKTFINVCDPLGRSPLYLAKSFGTPEAEATLIAAGADQSPEALKHTTELQFSCLRAKSLEELNAILKAKHDALLKQDDFGNTAFDYLLYGLEPYEKEGKVSLRSVICAAARSGQLQHPVYGGWVPKITQKPDWIPQEFALRVVGYESDSGFESHSSVPDKLLHLGQNPDVLLARKDGVSPLDTLLEAHLKLEKKVRILLDCLDAGHFVRASETWTPNDKTVYLDLLLDERSLKSFFMPSKWVGREERAFAMRDDMLGFLNTYTSGTRKNDAMKNIAAVDLTEMERIIAERRETARNNAGRFGHLLKRGGAAPGIG